MNGHIQNSEDSCNTRKATNRVLTKVARTKKQQLGISLQQDRKQLHEPNGSVNNQADNMWFASRSSKASIR